MGLAVGALLIGSGFLMAVVTLGQVGATHDDSGTYHACVSKYTGSTRIMAPGQPPSCTATEYPVELGAGDPADNLTYTVRTKSDDVSEFNGYSGRASVDCMEGETAINGGSRYRNNGTLFSIGLDFVNNSSGPSDGSRTTWYTVFTYTAETLRPGATIEHWVLCVS